MELQLNFSTFVTGIVEIPRLALAHHVATCRQTDAIIAILNFGKANEHVKRKSLESDLVVNFA